MKRNHVVILALLFALLPMLSACDSALMPNGEPEINGEWSALVDGVVITLNLFLPVGSDVSGRYTFAPTDPGISIRSGGVTGFYDSPDVTLFFNGSAFRGHVNAEGTSLTLFEDDGGSFTLTRNVVN